MLTTVNLALSVCLLETTVSVKLDNEIANRMKIYFDVRLNARAEDIRLRKRNNPIA